MRHPELDAASEASLDAALSRLAMVPAPATLLPRVLAATQMRATKPWYARTWDTWPVITQRLSVAVCLLVMAAMTQTLPFGDGSWIEAAVARAGGGMVGGLQAFAGMVRFVRAADAVSNTAGSLWQGVSLPLLVYASAVATLLCLVMGLFAMALDRLTPGRILSR